jgi:hypothetical protein
MNIQKLTFISVIFLTFFLFSCNKETQNNIQTTNKNQDIVGNEENYEDVLY